MGKCDAALRLNGSREREMMKPDEAARMVRLHELGWGTRRIAREFRCSRNTVRRYLEAGGWARHGRTGRAGKLAGLDEWLRERFHRHRGNAEVVRQELLEELSIDASLRTVERAVAPHRRLLAAEAKATLRFETPPGRQLQIDFGEARVRLGGGMSKAHLFVATLGYSRRGWADAFANQRQSSWFAGMEGAFRHFGGVPEEVLVGQREAAGVQARRRDAGGGVQRAVPGVRGALGLPSAGVRAVPGAHQGQGRARGAVRQGQRRRRPGVRQPRGAAGASGAVAGGGRGQAFARHHGGDAAGAVRARGGASAPAARPASVRAVAGSGAHGACGLHGGVGHERLLGAVAADRRAGAGGGERRARIMDRGHLAGVNAGPVREDGRRPEPALLRPLDEYAAVAGGRF